MKKIILAMRRLKDWMEEFAEKPNAMWWLFILSFAESSFFPIPPDVLLIAIAISNPKKAFPAAIWCTAGSVLGGIFGYGIGYYFMDMIGNPIIAFYGKEDAMASFLALYREWGVMFLAGAAFTPIPYKIATISSGAADMNLLTFISVSALGRAGRFFLVGGLIYSFGPKIKESIDKYFDKLSIIFLILLIAGFVAIKFLL
jgi:membrane protein YqaA with SNARE-associated domain